MNIQHNLLVEVPWERGPKDSADGYNLPLFVTGADEECVRSLS